MLKSKKAELNLLQRLTFNFNFLTLGLCGLLFPYYSFKMKELLEIRDESNNSIFYMSLFLILALAFWLQKNITRSKQKLYLFISQIFLASLCALQVLLFYMLFHTSMTHFILSFMYH